MTVQVITQRNYDLFLLLRKWWELDREYEEAFQFRDWQTVESLDDDILKLRKEIDRYFDS